MYAREGEIHRSSLAEKVAALTRFKRLSYRALVFSLPPPPLPRVRKCFLASAETTRTLLSQPKNYPTALSFRLVVYTRVFVYVCDLVVEDDARRVMLNRRGGKKKRDR